VLEDVEGIVWNAKVCTDVQHDLFSVKKLAPSVALIIHIILYVCEGRYAVLGMCCNDYTRAVCDDCRGVSQVLLGFGEIMLLIFEEHGVFADPNRRDAVHCLLVR
jgi:hypothetical protein